MQISSRTARTFVLAGLAAGTLTLLTTSPADAIGVRPVDPTNQPASLAPPPRPQPPGTPAPAPAPRAPAPAPPPAPAPAPRTRLQPVEPIEYVWWY